MAKFEFVKWLLLWLAETAVFHFEWDAGNLRKSSRKHQVEADEIEEVFAIGASVPLGVQILPKVNEERLALVGPTADNRLLMIVFTLRNGKVRVISGRKANRKERKFYEAFRKI